MSLKRAGIIIVRGTTYLVTARIATYFFSALTSIIIARYLGKSDYGLWSLAWSIFGIFTIFGEIPGTRPAIIRYVSKYDAENKPELVRSVVITSLKLRLLAGGLCTSIIVISASYIANNVFHYPELAVLITIFALGNFTKAFDLSMVFDALKKFHYVAGLDILGSILSFFLITVLIIGYGILGASIGQTIYMVLTSLLGFSLVYFNFLPPVSESQNRKNEISFISTSKRILAYSLPLSISGLIFSFNDNFRNSMLGLNVKSLEVLGYFAIALTITGYISGTTGLITGPLFPIISELDSKGHREKIHKLLSVLFKNAILFAGVAVIFVELFAPQIVCLIYSKEFEPAAIFLKMLIIIVLPGIFYNLFSTLFTGSGRSDVILKISVLSLLYSIPATILLIPNFWAIGAIAVILIDSFIYGLIIRFYFLKKEIGKIPFELKPMIKLIPALGIMTIFLFLTGSLIRHSAFYLILFSILALPMTYVLACFTGGIKKNEIDILQKSLPSNLQDRLQFIFSFLNAVAR